MGTILYEGKNGIFLRKNKIKPENMVMLRSDNIGKKGLVSWLVTDPNKFHQWNIVKYNMFELTKLLPSVEALYRIHSRSSSPSPSIIILILNIYHKDTNIQKKPKHMPKTHTYRCGQFLQKEKINKNFILLISLKCSKKTNKEIGF